MARPWKVTTIRLMPDQLEGIQEIVAEGRLDRSELIRQAVQIYLELHKCSAADRQKQIA